jgi:hypothetical protein
MTYKFSILIFLLLAFLSCKVFSQAASTPELTISCDRFISVFFPGKVREIINTNSEIEIKTSESSKNAIQIKARTPGFQQTRIEIVTVDQQRFAFDVSFSNELHGSTSNHRKVDDKRGRKQAINQ